MSNIIVDGFATYGTGVTATGGVLTPVANAMLSGAWADVIGGSPGFGPLAGGNAGIALLPWDPTNTDLYFAGGAQNATSGTAGVLRRVLPVTNDKTFISLYYALPALPALDGRQEILSPRDVSNTALAHVTVRPTGVIAVYNATRSAIIAQTAVPVVVAQTAYQLEMMFQQSTSAFQLYVNGTKVIDTTALTMALPVAQFCFLTCPPGQPSDQSGYISNLIIRNGAGSVNNTIMGDRKVATLLVNNDIAANQGWSAKPLKRFGAGILNLAYPTGTFNSGVVTAVSTATDLGNGDFTLDMSVRWQVLPQGGNKSVLFGKWDETSNQRSYQFYLGGPSLDSGALCFRISTDGQAGTVAQKILYPFKFDPGRWYHIALLRRSSFLMLYLDGVQYGSSNVSAETYFAGSARTAVGCQADNGANVLANTNFNGWLDEIRLTKGVRYFGNFTPPVTLYPRGAGADSLWSSVGFLAGFDNTMTDEGPSALALTALNGAALQFANDGTANFQVMAKTAAPFDDSFLEASFVQATNLYSLFATPSVNETVRLGTKDGTTPAVYRFVNTLSAAFDVLIGGSLFNAVNNLVAAITLGAGAGTTYHAATTANFDATATLSPTNQILATAILGGTAGNAIVTTATTASGSWLMATLTGGVNLPSDSRFGFQTPPRNTTLVDSVTLVQRLWKTNAGAATVQQSFVGSGGGTLAGASNNVTTVPTLYFDTFETDPDTAGPITPTTVVGARVKINRTV